MLINAFQMIVDFFLDYNASRNFLLLTDDRRSPPKRWVIIAIVIAIIFSSVVVVSVCILLRVCRFDGKHETINS